MAKEVFTGKVNIELRLEAYVSVVWADKKERTIQAERKAREKSADGQM